jgi:hypothetical protein
MSKGVAIVWLVLVTSGLVRGQDRAKTGTPPRESGSVFQVERETKGGNKPLHPDAQSATFCAHQCGALTHF